jgi:hypothetical protein
MNTAATSVVNVWLIRNKANEREGWVIKTFDGTFWYGAPIGLSAQKVDDAYATRLSSADFHLTGCFKGDLDSKYLTAR